MIRAAMKSRSKKWWLQKDGSSLNFCMVGCEHFVRLLYGSFWGWQIAIQRNPVFWVSLKTVLCRNFPLNCNKEPFCNICERFEAEKIFAVFTATSTRNCNFQRQVPGNCSDKEPYFLPDKQGITAFVLFCRDRRDRHIFSKNRRFLSEISVTHATPCRDNSPSNYPDFWKNANNHTIRERDTKFSVKFALALEK